MGSSYCIIEKDFPGRPWGKEVFDVALPDNIKRPGMIVTVPPAQQEIHYGIVKTNENLLLLCQEQNHLSISSTFIHYSKRGKLKKNDRQLF